MRVGFTSTSESGIADAIDFISKSNDFRTVYAWDENDNVKDIFYSSAKYKNAFVKKFSWDDNDNLIHVKLEDLSNIEAVNLVSGIVFGNDGRSKLEIPTNTILNPVSLSLKSSINKKYCLSENDSDYISAVVVDSGNADLVAEPNKNFKFSFCTLKYLTPNSQISLFMKVSGLWELIGTGVVDDTGYLITAGVRRL